MVAVNGGAGASPATRTLLVKSSVLHRYCLSWLGRSAEHCRPVELLKTHNVDAAVCCKPWVCAKNNSGVLKKEYMQKEI